MINLFTGTPGASKTANVIAEVEALRKRTGRSVYYSGIAELTLPWLELDDPTKWHLLPVGSIVVLDEAQRIFRPRHYSAGVPDFVAALETHRHQGIDLYLVTQSPHLVDKNVRAVVGRHVHLVRKWGAQASDWFEWLEAQDDPRSGRATADKKLVPFPKHVYGSYRSAEAHTHSFRMPRMGWYLIFGVVALVGSVGYLYVHFGNLLGKPADGTKFAESVAAGRGPGQSGEGGGGGPAKKPKTTEEYVSERMPRIPGLQHTAPVYDAVTVPVRAPVPQCVSMGKRCGCYSQQATVLDVPEAVCRSIVARGYFVDWDEAPKKSGDPLQAKQPGQAAGAPPGTLSASELPARDPVAARVGLTGVPGAVHPRGER